jgi:hypothetical protein
MPMSNPQFYTVMKYLFLLPLVELGLAILLDQFYFHFARGLPRWERLGHPLDTFCAPAQHVHAVLFIMHPLVLPRWRCSGLYITRPPERSCGSNRFKAWHRLADPGRNSDAVHDLSGCLLESHLEGSATEFEARL